MNSAPFYTHRVLDRTGSHIEPPLNPGWSNLEKLEWNLSKTLRDAGLHSDIIHVVEGRASVNGQPIETFNLIGERWTATIGDYQHAWSTISGIGYGLITLDPAHHTR